MPGWFNEGPARKKSDAGIRKLMRPDVTKSPKLTRNLNRTWNRLTTGR